MRTRPGGAGVAPGSTRGRWLTLLWALSPLAYGFSSGPCFGWAAWRLRSRPLAIEALAYALVTVLALVMAGPKSGASQAGGVLIILLAAVSCARAFVVRKRLLRESAARADADIPASVGSADADAGWSPVFPAQSLRREKGHGLASVVCDGGDYHRLSISMRQAALTAFAGAALVAVDLVLHVHGRGLGVGIGLLLVPLITVLFARWVDGPVLYYRRWGRQHELSLTQVTAVTAAKRAAGGRALLLSAPGLTKPLRLALQSRGYAMPTGARDHLRGWLSAPHVQWTPEARAVFEGEDLGPTSRGQARRRAVVLLVGLTLGGFGVVLPLMLRGPDFAIAGASGYSTFAGPHGKPLAIGRPWGEPCQPIRFNVDESVPAWVYAQVASVVQEARSDGIDVTLENRRFLWRPASLYYLDGQTPASTVRVAIFAQNGAPPRFADGQPEHINLGWDARLDRGGQHEDLTLVQGELWMQTLSQHPQAVRRAIRQLVAMTQGIIRTDRHDSAIAEGTGLDHFTAADVAAMKRMSGCSQTVGSLGRFP